MTDQLSENSMKTGLILEGGAMRGMFTAGVLDVFMERCIAFDGAIGVSAGAAFGCNLKSHQRGRALRYNKKYCKDWRYCSFRSLLTTGDLYGGEFDYQTMPKELDIWDSTAFSKDPMEFYCVATNAVTAKPIYHKCTDGKDEDFLWIQASASMPVVSRPVKINGKSFLDGGISDSVPLAYFQSIGYNRNVVLLTQPKGYRKKPVSFSMNLIQRMNLKKYPAMYQKLQSRWAEYNLLMDHIDLLEKEGKIFVIRPKQALEIGSICHDPEELQRVYDIGRKEGMKVSAAVNDFLKTKESV